VKQICETESVRGTVRHNPFRKRSELSQEQLGFRETDGDDDDNDDGETIKVHVFWNELCITVLVLLLLEVTVYSCNSNGVIYLTTLFQLHRL
jgi:hypothetical protein